MVGELAVLTGLVGACLLVGWGASRLAGPELDTWYPTLREPAWAPPGWASPVSWLLLHLTIAVATWLSLRRLGPEGRVALVLFGSLLVLHLLWVAVFFRGRDPAGALLISVLITALSAAATIWGWRLVPPAGLLYLPHVLWASLATAVNHQVWSRN